MLLPDIKNIEVSDKLLQDIDISNIEEMIRNVKNGNTEIVVCDKYFKGDGVKYFGEAITFEVLYTCKVCMHQRKDNDACNFDGLIHEHICSLFNKV